MTCKTSYELHHNFPKLADESGFTFNTHRPRIHIDWNKIRLIDLDSLIRDRKFVLVEQHVNDILDCVLESEFDVRILDEGVLKMFRLAQLAVEYHQFCRHYLDRSVFVLREEITSLIQELNNTKSLVQDKDDELKKIRRKNKSYKMPMSYGNENIATMILRTLSNKEMISSAFNNDSIQYNKCNYCDKVFMNQLYLKGHMSRRHGEVLEVPQKDTDENLHKNPSNMENNKLNDEIIELKNKLIEMEALFKQHNKEPAAQQENASKPIVTLKQTKDVEVSTIEDSTILDKIDEWKKSEQERHYTELNLLKSQIFETINSMKDKDNKAQSSPNIEPEFVVQLRETIKQQGIEINNLKQEVINTKKNTLHDEAENRKKMEEQMAFWVTKAENQSKHYELLLQKFNDVTKDAQESQNFAEAEKQRANQLQSLLEQSLNNIRSNDAKHNKKEDKTKVFHRKDKEVSLDPPQKRQLHASKSDSKTLEQLHRKAQELLNYGSSSSSENSINITIKHDKQNLLESNNITYDYEKKQTSDNAQFAKDRLPLPKANALIKKQLKPKGNKIKKVQITNKIRSPNKKQDPVFITTTIPGSPVKIVRAKITEEVNSRLVSLGVDPLKNRISLNDFRKQRTKLQKEHEKKTKGYPIRSTIRNSLITYLDTKTADFNKETEVIEYNSPNKIRRTSKLSSVLSNVKSRALSFVKSSHDTNPKPNKSTTLDITKRAMSFLKTPPDSPITKIVSKTKDEAKLDKKTTVRDKSKIVLNKNDYKNYRISKQSDSESDASDTSSESKNVEKNTQSKSSDSLDRDDKASPLKESKNLDRLIKSPAKRPSSAGTISKTESSNKRDNSLRASSVTDLFSASKSKTTLNIYRDDLSEEELILESPLSKKTDEHDKINIQKQTKSVLKNASSTSSLNKKKVLFDMDAIQMKSVSASPSQSTEKSDGKEKFALGIINFEREDWDISSIEDEQLKNDTKIHVISRTSPKITELKEAIESQLARRNDTPTVPVGGVDVLRVPNMVKVASLGGSNTSLGSSILDDSDGPIIPANHKALFKPKKVIEKEDSELDISEISIDGKEHKNDF